MRTATMSNVRPEAGAGYWIPPLRIAAAASRSCCCPSRPAVQVLIPPTDDRPPTELLLCAHHYGVSLDALMKQEAWIYGVDGFLLGEVGWSEPTTKATTVGHGADRGF